MDPDPDPSSSKNRRKTLNPTVLWLLFDCLFLKNYVTVPSKSTVPNKQKNIFFKLVFCWALGRSMTKIAGSSSGSISQRHGSADPTPRQNVMDPQRCLYLCGVQAPLKRRRLEAPASCPASSPRSSQPFMGSRGSRTAPLGNQPYFAPFFAYNLYVSTFFAFFSTFRNQPLLFWNLFTNFVKKKFLGHISTFRNFKAQFARNGKNILENVFRKVS